MHRQFKGIENEPCMRRGADMPANDLARIGINDEGGINKTLPSSDICEIRDP